MNFDLHSLVYFLQVATENTQTSTVMDTLVVVVPTALKLLVIHCIEVDMTNILLTEVYIHTLIHVQA